MGANAMPETSKKLKQISVYLDPDEVLDLEELVLRFKKARRPSPLSDSKTPNRNDLIRYAVQQAIDEFKAKLPNADA